MEKKSLVGIWDKKDIKKTQQYGVKTKDRILPYNHDIGVQIIAPCVRRLKIASQVDCIACAVSLTDKHTTIDDFSARISGRPKTFNVESAVDYIVEIVAYGIVKQLCERGYYPDATN